MVFPFVSLKWFECVCKYKEIVKGNAYGNPKTFVDTARNVGTESSDTLPTKGLPNKIPTDSMIVRMKNGHKSTQFSERLVVT